MGVNRDKIEHRQQVNPSAKPRKQMLRIMSNEKVSTTNAEFQRPLDVGFIREVQ
jgi:hypothetical protein